MRAVAFVGSVVASGEEKGGECGDVVWEGSGVAGAEVATLFCDSAVVLLCGRLLVRGELGWFMHSAACMRESTCV